MRCQAYRKEVHVQVSRDELGFLGNALNEVTHGFRHPDFEGESYTDAARLLRHISDAYEASGSEADIRIRMDAQQLRLLIGAIKATVLELGDEEMHTRTGNTVAEARYFLECLEQAQRPAEGSA